MKWLSVTINPYYATLGMGSQEYVVTTLEEQYMHFAGMVNMNERSHDMQGGGEQVVGSTVQQCTLHFTPALYWLGSQN